MPNHYSDVPEGFEVQYSDIPEGFSVETEPQEQKRAFSYSPLEGFAAASDYAKRASETPAGRQLGLAARYLTEGGLAIPALLADIPAAAGNLLLPGQPFQEQNRNISEGLTRLGLPEPETRQERIVGGASRALAAGGGMIGAGRQLASSASPVVSEVGQSLASAPAMQGASAMTGGGSAAVAKEAGAGPVGQVAAGLAGGMAPSLATAGLRGAFRGGETGRQTVERNVRDFQNAGTTPSVGQATQGRIQQAAESILSRTPGSAGRMASRAQSQATEIAQNVDDIARSLSSRSDSTAAGLSISRGISGSGGFLERFHGVANRLYKHVDDLIPESTPIQLSRTQAVLKSMTDPVPGAERTSRLIVNSSLLKIREALDDDVAAALDNIGQGSLPYNAVSALRSQVGRRLSNSGLVDDIPTGELKRLYGALSQDIETSAQNVSSEAYNAARRASTYYRSGLNRIEILESVVNRNGGPEKIFTSAMSGTREGATLLRRVMRSVPEQSRRDVAATVLKRMGRATPGNQNEAGDVFSMETFLTNWNRLSPEARNVLFSRFGGSISRNIDAISRVSANIREGSKVFANPSGTAQAATLETAISGAVLTALLGRLDASVAIIGGVAGSNLLARAMTNPTFVSWLARSTNLAPGALNAHIATLSSIAADKQDADMALIAAALEQDRQGESNP